MLSDLFLNVSLYVCKCFCAHVCICLLYLSHACMHHHHPRKTDPSPLLPSTSIITYEPTTTTTRKMQNSNGRNKTALP
ncbi:hypothetical protein B0T17DRAFT_168003 [Bombardia bombarda]|uniref:Uncharacterized protein n=1 Tax=Bombardia bombarda TaxID=252184 RepID=A0AA39X7N1_9PEZI|nr:hypothetical protein B0T17DRAFT_168003 [Bombardia bombarda]